MGNPTISHDYSSFLPSGWVHLFVTVIQGFIFFISGVDQGNKDEGGVQNFLV